MINCSATTTSASPATRSSTAPRRTRSSGTAPRVSASRVASGEKPLHRELEQELARVPRHRGRDRHRRAATPPTSPTIGHLVGAGRPDPPRRAGARLHPRRREALRRQAAARSRTTTGDALDRALTAAAAALPPGADRHRGRLLDGRRHPGPADVHRGEEEAQGAAAGRRGALHRRAGRDRRAASASTSASTRPTSICGWAPCRRP